MKNLHYNMLLGKQVTVKNTTYKITGMIEFKQQSYYWREFKLSTDENTEVELWLSIDKNGDAESYSLFQNSSVTFNPNTPTYNQERYLLIDEGTAAVTSCQGEVDCALGDNVLFKEYHAEADAQKLLSYEKWDDETEFSVGQLIGADEVSYSNDGAAEVEQPAAGPSFDEMNRLQQWQQLMIGSKTYLVVGWGQYKQGTYTWLEYRLRAKPGNKEYWLVVEGNNKDYELSLFSPISAKKVKAGPAKTQLEYRKQTFKKSDAGSAIVSSSSGDVDFDYHERVRYTDYTNSNGEILSKEQWSDGDEFSYGEMIENTDVRVLEINQQAQKLRTVKNTSKKLGAVVLGILATLLILVSIIGVTQSSQATIEKRIKSEALYEEVTSVTFKDSSKTKSAVYLSTQSVNQTCEDLIKLDPERIQYVTTDEADIEQGEKMIQTEKETVLIYLGEDGETYIQIFPNKDYNNTYTAYHSSNHRRLRSFYRSSRAWGTNRGSTPSYADGGSENPINVEHYDTQVASARQSSINARKQDGGGTGFGK